MTIIETWKYALPGHPDQREVRPASVVPSETREVDTTEIHAALMANVDSAVAPNDKPASAEGLEA